MISIEQVLEACENVQTRKAYEYGIREYLKWLDGREISYSTLKSFRAYLISTGSKPQTVNLRLAAVRFYVREMANEGAMPAEQAATTCALKNIKATGKRLGKWLTIQEAEALLNQPDTSTRVGLRDRSILALMIGAGLRRSEVVAIQVEHFEKRGEKWVIIGLVGKGRKVRNIPIADWVKSIVDAWLQSANIKTGLIVRKVSWSKKKEWIGGPLDPTTMRYIVREKYGKRIGSFNLNAHDLRRTSARLAYEGGVGIGQIQLMLGHSYQSITEEYIGARQDLTTAPSDSMGIKISTEIIKQGE